MVRTRAWRNGAAAERDFPLDQVSDRIGEDGVFVWVDFTDPTGDDLRQVEEELGVHALAVEDALEPGQRPKLDRYREGLFLVAYDVACPHDELETHEVKAFITKDALVTMHGAAFTTDEVEQRWDDDTDLADHGVLWLVWGVLDVLTDHAVSVAEQLGDQVDSLEDDLFASSGRGHHIQRRSFALRKALGTLRRLTMPMKDVVVTMLRVDEMRSRWAAARDGAGQGGVDGPGAGAAGGAGAGLLERVFGHGGPDAVPGGLDGAAHGVGTGPDGGRDVGRGFPEMNGLAPYFRDVADHLTNVADTIEEQRDSVSSVLETNLSLASNRQNTVMKKVTSWAAIIAIPTAITGFFGQNVSLPWGGTWWGLLLSSAVIAVTSVLLYGAFKRRDWL